MLNDLSINGVKSVSLIYRKTNYIRSVNNGNVILKSGSTISSLYSNTVPIIKINSIRKFLTKFGASIVTYLICSSKLSNQNLSYNVKIIVSTTRIYLKHPRNHPK